MLRYLIRRLLQMIPLLFLLSLLLFAALASMPGDPLRSMIEDLPKLTPEEYRRLRELYGLDDPIHVGYLKWLWQVLNGNLGYSKEYHLPVSELIGGRLWNTLILTVTAFILGKALAIVIGAYSARHPYSPLDYGAMGFAFFGFSVPGFWLGLSLIIVFSVHLQWLPAGGIASTGLAESGWEIFQDRARHLVLPVITLAVSETASTTRYMRSSLLEVIGQDYITNARSKGLSEQTILVRHALKNAMIPVVTVSALSLARLIGGSTVVETVFGYPGLGKLLFDAVMGSDYPLAMAILMLMSLFVVLANLLADFLYAWLDPRIRYA
jgi:peptide/nickel transport system permease protein